MRIQVSLPFSFLFGHIVTPSHRLTQTRIQAEVGPTQLDSIRILPRSDLPRTPPGDGRIARDEKEVNIVRWSFSCS